MATAVVCGRWDESRESDEDCWIRQWSMMGAVWCGEKGAVRRTEGDKE